MKAILSRLAEPSTYGGIAGALASLGLLGFGEGEWNTILGALAAVAAALAVVLGEKGKPQ